MSDAENALKWMNRATLLAQENAALRRLCGEAFTYLDWGSDDKKRFEAIERLHPKLEAAAKGEEIQS